MCIEIPNSFCSLNFYELLEGTDAVGWILDSGLVTRNELLFFFKPSIKAMSPLIPFTAPNL